MGTEGDLFCIHLLAISLIPRRMTRSPLGLEENTVRSQTMPSLPTTRRSSCVFQTMYGYVITLHNRCHGTLGKYTLLLVLLTTLSLRSKTSSLSIRCTRIGRVLPKKAFLSSIISTTHRVTLDVPCHCDTECGQLYLNHVGKAPCPV